MELLNYIFGHFWTMTIVEVVCLLLILLFPFIYWINERKDEKTLGDFYKYLKNDCEGWLVIITITLVPYLNIIMTLFVYTAYIIIAIGVWITDTNIYKKLINKLSKIRIR